MLDYTVARRVSTGGMAEEEKSDARAPMFHEAAGENQPPEEMSAKNIAEGMNRIFVFEL
jgi:hypothetical protein